MTVKYAEATDVGGAWTLPKNDIWNIPDDVNTVEFDVEYTRMPFRTISKVRGLVTSCEFVGRCPIISGKHRVYGVRTLTDLREGGYQLEGRVSLGGKKYSAFTSSQLFEREDGSLVSVSVIFVRMNDPENKEKACT